MAKNKLMVGVVLPAYNEATVIGSVLNEIPSSLTVGSCAVDIRIIVVNDASRDKTAEEVAKHPKVILISHILNSGAGAATRTGLNYAKKIGCDYALTMDSDGQHSVEDVVKLIKTAVNSKDSDFIIGSRLKGYAGNMPLSKKIGNVGLSFITFLLLGVYASDTQSGLKILNKKALDKVNFHSNGYAFCSEMIWKAHQSKLKIEEIPIKAIYTDYSVSRGQRNFTGAIEITKQLIKRRLMTFING